jgi:hypothetical protein
MSLITASSVASPLPAIIYGSTNAPKLYFRTDLTTNDQTITFGATSTAVEIINDSTAALVAINFTGAAAAIPTSGTSMVSNHLVRPKEARIFYFQGTLAHVISDTASTTIRVTVWYQ